MNRLAWAVACAVVCAAGEEPAEPRLTSAFPPAIQAGVPVEVSLRGSGLQGSRAIMSPVKARLAPKEGDVAGTLRVEFEAAPPGTFEFRLVTERGVSNAMRIHVGSAEVITEEAASVPLEKFPLTVAGRLAAPGETDMIWVQAAQGETLSFHCAAPGFDPALLLAEPSGSWFDEGRLNRLAFNDEPLHFPGLANEARLVHRFETAGRFAVQVRSFGGRGTPDYTYWLRIERAASPAPLLHPRTSEVWEERSFTRVMGPGWLPGLAARGGVAAPAPQEMFRVADETVMTIPGLLEGRISSPSETHRVKLRLTASQDLAIEIQTPEATMPRFNPVVRLLDSSGAEVVTNVYTKRNNNGLYMMKMIQAKSTFTLRSPGDYTLEVRDITTDIAGPDFAYRVLVRPQIPHAGKAEVEEDHINLEPGSAKALTVNVEREEGFAGILMFSAEGLPVGVTATMGMDKPVERPALPNGGRRERYVGTPQSATLLLTAAEDAPVTDMPVPVKVQMKTLIKGRLGPALPVKEIPVMIVPRRAS